MLFGARDPRHHWNVYETGSTTDTRINTYTVRFGKGVKMTCKPGDNLDWKGAIDEYDKEDTHLRCSSWQ